MLIPNHPDAERLAAFAEGDTDASADASLRTHLSSCIRCGAVVADLGVLRSALGELPDVAPHRPLRLLPPVEAEAAGGVDRLGGWARRLFAPALTAGAALAMVGIVGTAMPQGMGGAGQAATDAVAEESTRELAAAASERTGEEAAAGGAEASRALEYSPTDTYTDAGNGEGRVTAAGSDAPEDGAAAASPIGVERSPWPMVLFTGVALMIAAALLRWILVPGAG